MKKTKVVIPALGIIAFATAASITGTVAWFTASRTAVVTAGEFAVINTKDNLDVALTAGVGTSVNATPGTKQIDVVSGNLLTDGSVDHTNATAKPTIIAPDASGVNVGKIVDFDTTTASELQRGTSRINAVDYTIYTAFTWDMSFTVSFAGSQDKNVGLFLDLGAETWAHEVVHIADGEVVGADKAGTYKPNADLSGNDVVIATGTNTGAKTLYKAAPDNTGKGFRIAFIPKSVPENSFGYSKIWAPHQTNDAADDNKCLYIDYNEAAATAFSNSETYDVNDVVTYNGTYYKCTTAVLSAGEWTGNANWTAVSLVSKSVNLYNSTATSSLTTAEDTATRAAATSAAGVVMDSNDHTAIPEDLAVTKTTALSGKSNYLGYFAPKPNGTVTLTYTCIAYYEGTDENIINTADTIYETMTVAMKFGVATLNND